MKKFLASFKASSKLLPNDHGKIIQVNENANIPQIFKVKKIKNLIFLKFKLEK